MTNAVFNEKEVVSPAELAQVVVERTDAEHWRVALGLHLPPEQDVLTDAAAHQPWTIRTKKSTIQI